MTLIFASNNEHKLQEIKQIIGNQHSVVLMSEVGINTDIAEDATTLEGNSEIKARFVYEHCHNTCFADDTGLEIEALNNQPGVMTARFSGEHNNSAANRAKVLKLMNGERNRKARFRSVITLILNGKSYQFEGKINGQITTQEQGERGFGYDCIFMPDGYDRTFAQLREEEKNQISHRSIAMAKMLDFLNKTE